MTTTTKTLRERVGALNALDAASDEQRIKHDFDTTKYIQLQKLWPKDYALDMFAIICEQSALIEKARETLIKAREIIVNNGVYYDEDIIRLDETLQSIREAGYGAS